MTTIPFCNDAGQSASDLHIHFAFPYSGRTFLTNPTGCPEPSFEPTSYGLDTFDLEVDWGVACVDPGEFLTLEFRYACGDVPCNTPQPFCYTWTRFGEPVYQGPGDCPSPTETATPTPIPPGTPTATPTPTIAPPLEWGDLNCSGEVDAGDALRALGIVAGLYMVQEVCASPDVDCDGDTDAVDALKILRYVAGLAYSQSEPCPDIGQSST